MQSSLSSTSAHSPRLSATWMEDLDEEIRRLEEKEQQLLMSNSRSAGQMNDIR
jgi:hypothetical protein